MYCLAVNVWSYVTIKEAFTNYEKSRLERTKIIQTYSAKREIRYYETDEQKAGREATPESQTIDEIRQWLYSYKPSAVGLVDDLS